MTKIAILGVTGSIGTQTIDVIRREIDNFKLIAISANKNIKEVVSIVEEFNPPYVVITDKPSYEVFLSEIKNLGYKGKVLYGMDGLNFIASLEEVDIVVTSIVGMVGLEPTLKAIEAKKTIALANKETLVVGGEIVMEAARKNGVRILPVDSEHSAIFQSLQGSEYKSIKNILLTASGGPFRGRKKNDLIGITPKEALKHPNWSMGKKISIDSATLMNKGLEVIEAKWLFDVNYDDIKVIVHPESIIHSMVEYNDGSIIAQLGTADMRLPIQYALNYPNRKAQIVDSLDFYKVKNLTFEQPDIKTFKSLGLAYEAGKIGGLMPTILNGANEVCVDLFLKEKITFLQIADIIEETMDKLYKGKEVTLENILEMDLKTRKYIEEKFY
ncbi:MAG: 1-deoxy-D-xylulose-5-phosphate reductoisomerase [Clostridium sp.]|uniref:1-deoxy-D-xylulose-5-phosphate reductoisomerase n=1 Tax=Clostridium sp. TaxID=1506 RepID=UPI002A8536E5|nr:1-deoxy-D-xylulose-5-phosphate reductoisomerase [Clostridium sp.]MDY5098176.1 1-deoxy-D-xylulose-5-phosphate reductoisomerase [Clostridium sp.]